MSLLAASLWIWTSMALHEAVRSAFHNAHALELSGQVETELLSHSRISNLYLANGDRELRALRADARKNVGLLLNEIASFADSPAEQELMGQVRKQLDVYFMQRDAIEAGPAYVKDAIEAIQPTLATALVEVDDLQALNREQLTQARNRAAQLETFAKVAGAIVILVVVPVFLGALLFYRKQLIDPILRISEVIERFRTGDRTVKAREEGPVEIARISRAFNEATEALLEQRHAQLEFVASVAHDLRNPLSGMSMALQVLEQAPGQSAEATRSIAVLQRHTQRLAAMLTDLLDAARIEAGELDLQLSMFDLRDIARETVELYQPTSSAHDLVLEIPSHPIPVTADQARIAQVANNLVSNAIKYSPHGGPVCVRVYRDDGRAVLSVTDRGTGMSVEEMSGVFTPFRRGSSRESTPGAGLGLSVVRRIVEGHGGTIEVDSCPGAGSSFRVVIPRARDAATERRRKRGDARGAQPRKMRPRTTVARTGPAS